MSRFPPDKLLGIAKLWVLVAFVLLIAATGGASRWDVQSLVVLRPVAALTLGFALWFVTREQLWEFRWPIWLLVATCIAIAMQLVPLPPAVWSILPGRELVAQVDATTRIEPRWRPISLVPFGTWNALYAMVVPIAVLLMMAVQPIKNRRLMLPVLIAVGLFSGLMGLMQAIGPAHGPLYLYRITNYGTAVGLFANRNHEAVLLACLFPMLGTFAALKKHEQGVRNIRLWLCIGAGALLVPLILVTGSRLGLLLGGVGLAAGLFLYFTSEASRSASGRVRGKRPIGFVVLGGVVLVGGLIAMTVLMSRGAAVDRLLATNVDDDVRKTIWTTSVEIIRAYFPVGSGYGSFTEIYQIYETDAALKPTYSNRAHNDVIEVALSGGLIGIALMLAGVVAWFRATLRVFRTHARSTDIVMARLGSVLLLLCGIASLTDYPLRIPLIAALAAVAAGWLVTKRAPGGGSDRMRAG